MFRSNLDVCRRHRNFNLLAHDCIQPSWKPILFLLSCLWTWVTSRCIDKSTRSAIWTRNCRSDGVVLNGFNWETSHAHLYDAITSVLLMFPTYFFWCIFENANFCAHIACVMKWVRVVIVYQQWNNSLAYAFGRWPVFTEHTHSLSMCTR